MARLVFGMMQSLDGYIEGPPDAPGLPIEETLHQHFNDQLRGSTGMLYGRRIYEVMRYWDVDELGQDAVGLDFGAVWRSKPIWVVSNTLKSVGPNATLVEGDLETFVRRLKATHDGEIDVAGAELAGSLTQLGLIDEYRLYLRPLVHGSGKPFFSGPRPPLRLVSSERIGEYTMRLVYVPAG